MEKRRTRLRVCLRCGRRFISLDGGRVCPNCFRGNSGLLWERNAMDAMKENGSMGQDAGLKPLLAKLLLIMRSAKSAEKSGWNDHLQKGYATEDDLVDAVRGALIEHGVYLQHSVVSTTSRDAAGKQLTVARVSIKVYDVETGVYLESFAEGEADQRGGFAIASAVTSAVRMGLQRAFLLPLHDPDGAGGARRPPASQKGGQKGQAGGGGQGPRRNPAKDDEPISVPQLGFLKNLMEQAGVSAETICSLYRLTNLQQLPRRTWYDEVQPRLKKRIAETQRTQSDG
jgi:hypothetical protein